MPEIIMTCLENGNVGEVFQFPTLPAEINVNGQPAVQNYKIINIGSVKIPKGNEVDTVSWDSYFFNPSAVTGALHKNSVPPVSCVQVLDYGRRNRTKWRLMVTDYGINLDVFIAKFNWKPYGGYGNIKYSIELDKWVDLQVKLLAASEPAKDSADKPKARESKPKSDSYTIKKGDTLSAIARKMTGSSSNWKAIYNANKSAIESEAKKYGHSSDGGHWIYPGMTLSIPKS